MACGAGIAVHVRDLATGGSVQMRGFATGVGSKADIGAAGADPTLVYEYTP